MKGDFENSAKLSASLAAAIHEVVTMNWTLMDKSALPGTMMEITQCSILQCCPADAFLYQAENKATDPILLILPDPPQVMNHPLISIGPNSDTILDQFKLGDGVISQTFTYLF